MLLTTGNDTTAITITEFVPPTANFWDEYTADLTSITGTNTKARRSELVRNGLMFSGRS